MFLQVVFIYLGGFVLANVRDDIGNIPYENPAKTLAPAEMPVPDKDYGVIPYDKAPANNDAYGNVPYEDAAKPDVQVDYGDIPYDKVGGLTPQAKNRTMDIPDGNIFRAAEDDDPDYHSPGTIDDSDCDPRKMRCSTCRDKEKYRIYCLDGTTTVAPTDLIRILNMLVRITDVYWSNGDLLTLGRYRHSMNVAYPKSGGWPVCPTTTSTTTTPSPTWPPHNFTGQTIAKCFVCGMLDSGIPQEDRVCSDSFLSHAYRKHCKFLNRDGWHINGSGGFYMWGRWSGGCSLRFTDISTVYHQRTCRDNVTPAQGHHYISRRMAQLEFTLRREKDACLASPTASLVPLSRGVSLFSRFHVCVCSKNYCNRAERVPAVIQWYTVAFAFAYISLRLCEVLQEKVTF